MYSFFDLSGFGPFGFEVNAQVEIPDPCVDLVLSFMHAGYDERKPVLNAKHDAAVPAVGDIHIGIRHDIPEWYKVFDDQVLLRKSLFQFGRARSAGGGDDKGVRIFESFQNRGYDLLRILFHRSLRDENDIRIFVQSIIKPLRFRFF